MKTFITLEQLRLDSFKLGEQIIKDEFKPDYLIGLWRGCSIIALNAHELLKYCYKEHKIDLIEHDIDNIAIRTSRYIDPNTTLSKVQVHNLGYLVERLTPDSKVIIIDDVYDTGLSIKAVIDELSLKLRCNMPKDIRVATVDYKPEKNKTNRVPDYYVNKREATEWLVYPHELEGLTLQEISDNFSPEIAEIVESCLNSRK